MVKDRESTWFISEAAVLFSLFWSIFFGTFTCSFRLSCLFYQSDVIFSFDFSSIILIILSLEMLCWVLLWISGSSSYTQAPVVPQKEIPSQRSSSGSQPTSEVPRSPWYFTHLQFTCSPKKFSNIAMVNPSCYKSYSLLELVRNVSSLRNYNFFCLYGHADYDQTLPPSWLFICVHGAVETSSHGRQCEVWLDVKPCHLSCALQGSRIHSAHNEEYTEQKPPPW